MKKIWMTLSTLALVACAAPPVASTKDGLVEFAGAQQTIFASGRADPVLTVADLARGPDFYGVGPVAGLDGEITVFQGKAYVTQVRGGQVTLDHDVRHGAIFAVWTQQSRWTEEPVPAQTRTYLELQQWVKTRAAAAGVDVTRPFPFRLAGTPAEVKWHINVDLTRGQPVTRELFAKSKAAYVARGQAMDIIGFYSEKHNGVFISALAPAIPEGSSVRNALHLHLVSRDGAQSGHIDDLTLAPGMTLLLPQR